MKIVLWLYNKVRWWFFIVGVFCVIPAFHVVLFADPDEIIFPSYGFYIFVIILSIVNFFVGIWLGGKAWEYDIAPRFFWRSSENDILDSKWACIKRWMFFLPIETYSLVAWAWIIAAIVR